MTKTLKQRFILIERYICCLTDSDETIGILLSRIISLIRKDFQNFIIQNTARKLLPSLKSKYPFKQIRNEFQLDPNRSALKLFRGTKCDMRCLKIREESDRSFFARVKI